MKNRDDVVWGLLFGTLLLATGLYLFGYIALTTRFSPQATLTDIMAHWPQLQAAPSFKGIRGELGGRQLPDHIDLGKLPKAGVVWPCSGQEEAAQVCYLNADFSQPVAGVGIDIAQDYQGKYVFIMRKEATR